MPMLPVKRLNDVRVGDVPVYKLTSTDSTTGAAWNIASATAVWIDPGRTFAGTATGGTTITLTCTTAAVIAMANDSLNGLDLTITTVAGVIRKTRITDFAVASSIATLTFGTLEAAPASGDTFVVEGYPLIVRAAVSPSTNTLTLTGTAAVTTYTGRRVILVDLTYSGSGPYCQPCEFDVLPGG